MSGTWELSGALWAARSQAREAVSIRVGFNFHLNIHLLQWGMVKLLTGLQDTLHLRLSVVISKGWVQLQKRSFTGEGVLRALICWRCSDAVSRGLVASCLSRLAAEILIRADVPALGDEKC